MIMRDLTEKNVAEDRLGQTMRNLEVVLQSIPQGVVYYGADTKLIYANDAHADMFGIERDAVRPGMNLSDVILAVVTAQKQHSDPKKAACALEEKMRSSVRRGECTSYVIEYARSRFAAFETQLMHDGSWVTLLKDITEQKRIAAELRDSEQCYRDIFDNSSNGVFVVEVTPEHRFKFEQVNPAVEHMFSISNEEVRGFFIEDILQPAVARDQILRYEACLAAGTTFRYEEAIRFPTGNRQFETTLVPVRGNDGTIRRIIGIARDLAEERQLNQMRVESEGYFHTLVENSPDVIVRFDRNCRPIYANPAYERIAGVSAWGCMGKTPVESGAALGPKQAASLQKRIERVIATGVADEINVDFVQSGENSHFWIRAIPETDVDGAIVSVLTIARNMTDRIKAERQLRQREQEYRSLVENSPDLIARYDRQGRRIYVNPTMREQLGIAESRLGEAPTSRSALVNPGTFVSGIYGVLEQGTSEEMEVAARTVDGRIRFWHVRLTPEFDEQGTVTSVLMVGHDITELVESREKINRLAFYDALTDLPNRTLLHDRVRELIASAASFGFLMLDLDGFKTVNDTLGHAVGDLLLCEVAQRLRCCLRETDIVARLGGDEFAIVLPNIRSRKGLAAAAVRILGALAEPVPLADREITVSASIGIARYPLDSENFLEILKNSDAAMYKAKSAGRNNYQFYDAGMMARAIERMMIEVALRKALPHGEFELYYQPQVLLPTGCIIGAEALLRWRHPDLGLLTPDRFISIAEETGLIVEIGRWVIETACRAAVEWNCNCNREEPLLVSANISPRQVTHNDLAAVVADALAATGCKPQWLCLELTESLFLEDKHTAKKTLDALKKLGVSIAVDDFGTGYSALSYLSDFPFDVLKIDRSFVGEIGVDDRKTELMKAIIGIAKALDLKLVAEGVETKSQSEILEKSGCRIAQGYLFGKPMPGDAFTGMLLPTLDEKLRA